MRDPVQSGFEPAHEPPITRAACVLLILGLGMIPVESAVRAALYGLDFAQQFRVAEHWLRQITNGFVPGDRMPFAWLAVLLAAAGAGVLSAVARGAHPANRADAAGAVTGHALVVVPLAIWFGTAKMIPLLIVLLLAVTFRLVRFLDLPVIGRRPTLTFALICILLVGMGLMNNFRMARLRANLRACLANQKTLCGAVEMYNLDKNTQMERLNLKELASQGYL